VTTGTAPLATPPIEAVPPLTPLQAAIVRVLVPIIADKIREEAIAAQSTTPGVPPPTNRRIG
jgi:hypothetical protein